MFQKNPDVFMIGLKWSLRLSKLIQGTIFWSSEADVSKTLLLAVRELCTAIPYCGAKTWANTYRLFHAKCLASVVVFFNLNVNFNTQLFCQIRIVDRVCEFLLLTMHRYSCFEIHSSSKCWMLGAAHHNSAWQAESVFIINLHNASVFAESSHWNFSRWIN